MNMTQDAIVLPARRPLDLTWLHRNAIVRALGNRRIQLALAILGPILFLTIFRPILPIPGPLQTNLREMMQPPSLGHLFGTDKMGRDLVSRTLAGIQISVFVGFAVATLALVLGLVMGTLAGF